MRNIVGAKAFLASVVLATAPFSLSPAARADTTLLSLTPSGSQVDTPYSFTFVASDVTSTISFAGYQVPSWEEVTGAAVTLGGGSLNLLDHNWTFTPAAKGSDAYTFIDGSHVRGLQFGGVSAGYYDTFSQVLATVIGDTYTLSFLFSNNAHGRASEYGPSALLVSYQPDGPLQGGGNLGGTGASNTAVPEPSTWAMALLGFAAIGYAGWNRRREKVLFKDA